MWRYRLKKVAWYLAPQVYFWLTAWLVPKGNVLNIIWAGVVIMLLTRYCWPAPPRRPATKWWVQSKRSIRPMWHDEAWSPSRGKAETYLRKHSYQSSLKWRLIEREIKQ